MPKRIPGGLAILLALPLASTAIAEQCHILRSPPIPVTMLDRQPIISAKINGAAARFMVDTGSSVQLLFPSAAAEFKLQVKLHPGLYTLGVGGYDNPDTATVKSFTFGSTQVPNVLFLVSSNDLSDSGIAGILGQNLFQLWDEEFDLANGVMRLVEPQHCGGKILAYWAGNQPVSVVDLQATTKTDTELIGAAEVNGHAIRVLFDTGSSTSGLSLEAARRIGITPDSPGVVAAGFAEGLTQQQLVQTWIAPIAEFAIGSEKIEHTRITFGNIHSRYEDPEEHYDMLLGADFFLAHHVYVANSQSKLYFTYSGGPVFNVNSSNTAPARKAPPGSGTTQIAPASATAAAATNSAASDSSASSSDLMRRGLAEESRGLLDQALADISRACDLDSRDADCVYQRGMAHWRLREQDLALKDFDAAVQLSPNLYLARLARAELQLRQLQAAVTPDVDTTAVKPDVDAVDRFAPQADNVRFTLAELYNNMDLYAQAVHEITVWISYHPDDVMLGSALNWRCWYRGEANQDLDQALQDCNRALHLAPGNPQALNSRALVYMRLGKLDDAIGDYDATLKQNPKLASSLFGRGLAELRKGQTAQGQADIAAAESINPRVGGFFARFGLKP
jgi:tetratricopeptide (TPR) repeat protein